MLSLTGRPLFVLMVVLALAVPVITVSLWSRRRAGEQARRRALFRIVGRAGLVVTSQILAMSAVFLWVNNQYGFYTSWSDLVGRPTQTTQIQTNGLITGGSDSGSVEVLTVRGTGDKTVGEALVWLPPQYRDPQNATRKFPVVMFLPGQPSTPQATFKNYNFAAIASGEIRAGRIKPFIAVFPPLMTRPPRDTECTNVPGGPQAETWLSSDVPSALASRYHTEPPGARWSVMGWSTGGFCAAKLLVRHPRQFTAAVSFGGYYDPLTDSTTGDLFGNSSQRRNDNSPRWLYGKRGGLGGGQLLMVTGQQDRYAWRSTQKMLATTRGDRNVSLLSFPAGGHNYRNYRTYLGQALQWLDSTGAAG